MVRTFPYLLGPFRISFRLFPYSCFVFCRCPYLWVRRVDFSVVFLFLLLPCKMKLPCFSLYLFPCVFLCSRKFFLFRFAFVLSIHPSFWKASTLFSLQAFFHSSFLGYSIMLLSSLLPSWGVSSFSFLPSWGTRLCFFFHSSLPGVQDCVSSFIPGYLLFFFSCWSVLPSRTGHILFSLGLLWIPDSSGSSVSVFL